MQRQKDKDNQERIALADKVIMIEKLIREKEMQLQLLKHWLNQVREGKK